MTRSKTLAERNSVAGKPTDGEKTRPSKATTNSETDSAASGALAPEVGGRTGPEPTRYGDWQRKGITSDF